MYVKLNKVDSLKDEVEGDAMKGAIYASIFGSLMYAMIATRPNIVQIVGELVIICLILEKLI